MNFSLHAFAFASCFGKNSGSRDFVWIRPCIFSKVASQVPKVGPRSKRSTASHFWRPWPESLKHSTQSDVRYPKNSWIPSPQSKKWKTMLLSSKEFKNCSTHFASPPFTLTRKPRQSHRRAYEKNAGRERLADLPCKNSQPSRNQPASSMLQPTSQAPVHRLRR